MRKALLILLSVCMYYSCDYVDDTLILKNLTSEKLYYLVLNKDLTGGYNPMLDSNGIKQYYTNYVREILPSQAKNEIKPGKKGVWKLYVKASKDNSLHIFLFNLDTLKTYDWRKVVYQKKYEKELKFTYQQLEEMNWIIPVTK